VLIPDLSEDQRRFLEVAYRGFRESASWPTSAHVDAILDQEYSVDFETSWAGFLRPSLSQSTGMRISLR
jgi:hypothetical protein